jgi:sulfur carrier protein
MDLIKKFFVNGQEYETSNHFTLSQLLYYFNYRERLFVIEYNNLICDQKHWPKIKIKINDKIEIVTIVGGG